MSIAHPDYTRWTARRLRSRLASLIREFQRMPHGGFSALYVGGEIERIQRELDRRGLSHPGFYPEVRVR